MAVTLLPVELAKFDLLQTGIAIDPDARAHIDELNKRRALSSADYASTSGVILKLGDDVWVNAPTIEHNANFVTDDAARLLLLGSDGLVASTRHGDFPASVWMQPAWHSAKNAAGVPYSSFGVSHTDRVRVSPIEGCAFTCTFCDLPYEFRYRAKQIEALVETVSVALNDPDQPAAHVLISGGTPRPEDYSYVRDCYEAILTSFPDVPVDIMMVPLHEVLDIERLAGLGLAEVSINMEVWSDEVARRVMPRKHKQGRQHYLEYLEHSAAVLGGHRVRSMLMLGLEPLEATLEGVAAIAELGCVPVLSPFRPDPSTPLRNWQVPAADFLREAYEAAWEICAQAGVPLGPPCGPCAHNTLTLPASGGHGSATKAFGEPVMIGA